MKKTLIFCLFLLFVSALSYWKHTKMGPCQFVVEVVGSHKIYKKPLNNHLEVSGFLGKTVIEWLPQGTVRIIESPCKNKTCIHMGESSNIPIICAPNGIIVKPVINEYDAVSQ